MKSSVCSLYFLTDAGSTSLLCCLWVWTHVPLSFDKLGTMMTEMEIIMRATLSLSHSHTHTHTDDYVYTRMYRHISVFKDLFDEMVFQINGGRGWLTDGL